MGWIYILTFPNEKQYIGQTINLKRRYSEYRANKKSVTPIYYAIQKYGWENIDKYEIECPEEFLDEIETLWIKNFNTLVPNGYNLQYGGQKKHHHHNDTKNLLSELGRKHPGNMTGHKQSEEWKKNHSEFMTGKKYAKGYKPSEEKKKKQSEWLKANRNRYKCGGKKIPILQYSINGQFIKEWESAKQASEELKITRGLIGIAIKNKNNAVDLGGIKKMNFETICGDSLIDNSSLVKDSKITTTIKGESASDQSSIVYLSIEKHG